METKNEWDILASKYETVFQPRFKPMYQHMAKIALANPHHKLVDFATGPGEPSRSIVEKLISDGNTENTVLILSDSSEGMLKVAKSKISPLLDSVKGLDVKFEYTEAFCVSPSMSNLDTLLVSLGLMYMSNLDSLLQEFSKSLLPQGRVISSHWPHPSKVI
ncbi:hypothetical protein BC833DRAFT_86709 [Globomyces pollinis-pini]|nr:hypothetical protein BC833DRAFT_86709 [Globomyces pollinis-pini]